jgi:hypothetical protein
MDGFPTGLFVASAAVVGGALYASSHMLSDALSLYESNGKLLRGHVLNEGIQNERLRAGLLREIQKIDRRLAAQEEGQSLGGNGRTRPPFETIYTRAMSEGALRKEKATAASAAASPDKGSNAAKAKPSASLLNASGLGGAQDEIQRVDTDVVEVPTAASNVAE